MRIFPNGPQSGPAALSNVSFAKKNKKMKKQLGEVVVDAPAVLVLLTARKHYFPHS